MVQDKNTVTIVTTVMFYPDTYIVGLCLQWGALDTILTLLYYQWIIHDNMASCAIIIGACK